MKKAFVLDTPRNGKNWMDLVNTTPLPVKEKPQRVVIGTMTAAEYRDR